MKNAREELERIIKEKFQEKCSRGEVKAIQYVDTSWAEWIKLIAQAIFSAGFIRLEDVEIDEDKLRTKLYENLQMVLSSDCVGKLATAISQAKGILRVKEGK